jgi:hypothetical protein
MKGHYRSICGCLAVVSVIFAFEPLATQAQEMCGGTSYPFPYTDVASVGTAFCPGIMQAYVTGVSKGTTPTTFSPNETVTRVQMTTFLQRALDQGLARGSRRAALNQWATPQNINSMQTVAVNGNPSLCAADGEDIWTTTQGNVIQVHASNGKIIGTWTGAVASYGVVVAVGKVYMVSDSASGLLYVLDPTQPPGPVTVAATIGNDPNGIAFDGTNLWTANYGGSVSIITPQPPYDVTTVTTGFVQPAGVLYDGANIWVTDAGAGTLLKLDPNGNVIQTVNAGTTPAFPVFDGTNIWVPNFHSNSITVVQSSSGTVVKTITADASNLLSLPIAASFDGERILVANFGGGTVTLFKAADLSFIANASTGLGTVPSGACSDGTNFWVTLIGTGNLLRF